jgi:hypothetical protein
VIFAPKAVVNLPGRASQLMFETDTIVQSQRCKVTCCLPPTLLAEDDAIGGAKKKGAAGKAGAKGGSSHKPPKSRWQRLSKVLFGWTNSTFKVNGKKLLPHNAVLWKFMVRRTLHGSW